MDNIGAEVGQKMRSAIKAKLMELGCYVDDELPDYIMVMVANKRTKSQMNEDLQLFLTNKTSAFVDWLQIVLKKLKEITVTNPDIYKRASKRKVEGSPKSPEEVKKEKKDKSKKNKKKEPLKEIIKDIPQMKSLTDDLPVQASKLSEMRKIIIMQEHQNSCSGANSNLDNNEDGFDIPPLSEVAESNEAELAEIEKRIRSVKSRLGLQIPSGSDDEDFINIKAEPDELLSTEHAAEKHNESDQIVRRIEIIEEQTENIAALEEAHHRRRNEHPRIIFGNEPAKKQSVLERLGKRLTEDDSSNVLKKNKINLTDIRREEEEILNTSKPRNDTSSSKSILQIEEEEEKQHKKAEMDVRKLGAIESSRESALKRLGVMSKVAVPQKETIESDLEEVINKEVPSSVRVKPRVLPPLNNQANKNLLLKAVAEAQKSIAQTPLVGTNRKPDALFTKKYREKIALKSSSNKLSIKNKVSILTSQVNRRANKKELDFGSDDDLEYIPKPIKKATVTSEQLAYIPSMKSQSYTKDSNYTDTIDYNVDTQTGEDKTQTFIITLDGVSEQQSNLVSPKTAPSPISSVITEHNLDKNRKKSPSPIIFDAPSVNTKSKQLSNKPSAIHSHSSVKIERCKYWPACRQGDKCGFFHPITSCKAFPACKFGDKCLYVHPTCKFETSCTRKDCPYSHSPRTSSKASTTPQLCKYFPNCSYSHCMYYHPKPCKFGKHCKNQSECNYTHSFRSKSNLTWRSTVKL